MKRTMTYQVMLILLALGLFSFNSGSESGKVHLKVTKNEGGKTTVLQKSYENMEALKSDNELEKFDILLKEWANEAVNEKEFTFNQSDRKENVIIMKKPGDESMTWVNDKGDTVRTEKEITIIRKDGKEEKIVNEQKKVMVFTDENNNETIIKIDGESEEGNTWTDDKGNVMKSQTGSGNKEVIIMKDSKDHPGEMNVEVITESGENGEQKTVTKKVWVTEDGNKMELEGDDKMEFITNGDTVNITIDRMENSEFAMGEFKGDKMIMIKKRGEEGPGETMDVEVENKNGEQFIEINIRRSAKMSVTISDIVANDAAVKGATVSLKSNLKASSVSYDPNPSAGKFNLKFALDQKDPVTVKVLDISGSEIYSETVMDFEGNYNNQIDLKGKSKGIYILQISQNKKSLTKKIVIE